LARTTLILIALLAVAGVVNGEQCNEAGSVKGGAVKPTMLPKGISTWVLPLPRGIARQIERHNSKAPPGMRFSYPLPYAGSVASAPRKASHGTLRDNATHAYVSALPDILMLPIVDGRTDQGEFRRLDGRTKPNTAKLPPVADCVNNERMRRVSDRTSAVQPDHCRSTASAELLNAKGVLHDVRCAGRMDILVRVFQPVMWW